MTSNLDVRGKQITPYTSIQLYPELRKIIRDKDSNHKGRAAEDWMLMFMRTVIPDLESCREIPHACDLYSKSLKIRIEIKNILSSKEEIRKDATTRFERDCIEHINDTNLFVFVNIAYNDHVQTHMQDKPLRLYVNGKDMNKHMLQFIVQTANHMLGSKCNVCKEPSKVKKVIPIEKGNAHNVSVQTILRFSNASSQTLTIKDNIPKPIGRPQQTTTVVINNRPTTPKLKLVKCHSLVNVQPSLYVYYNSYIYNNMWNTMQRTKMWLHKTQSKLVSQLGIINILPNLRELVNNSIVINKCCKEQGIKYRLLNDNSGTITHFDDCGYPIILCDARGIAYEMLTKELIDRLYHNIHKNDQPDPPKGIFGTIMSWLG